MSALWSDWGPDLGDVRLSQRIIVTLRWVLIVTWLVLIHYRVEYDSTLATLDGLAALLVFLNGYLTYRIVTGRPVGAGWLAVVSLFDLAVITAGLGVTTAFENTFFVAYFPALVGVALVFPRWMSGIALVGVVVSYTLVSTLIEPGIDTSMGDEKVLVIRLMAMVGVVVGASLLGGIERQRRREAVADALEAVHYAELSTQRERERIGREIHDGVAQSMYAVNLNLETLAALASRRGDPLAEDLKRLVPLAKKTLLETRHYIHDLRPLLEGGGGLATMVERQVHEFGTVAGITAKATVQGRSDDVPLAVSGAAYRTLQEALANVLKHANAGRVTVDLLFDDRRVQMIVEDDGVGFDSTSESLGLGLTGMRERAEELGGVTEIVSAPGGGTRVKLDLPTGAESE
jgi:signal transduction histidine kinase